MKLIDKQVVRRFLVWGVVVVLGVLGTACKGGGGSGGGSALDGVTDAGGSKEEVVEPEDPRGEEEEREEKEALFIKKVGQVVELELTDGKFFMRLECQASGKYSGSVLGGEVRCYTEDADTYEEVERRVLVMGGSWEQTVGSDNKLIEGLRFELSGSEAAAPVGTSAELRVLGVDLRVFDEVSETERVGYAEGTITVTLGRGEFVIPPSSSTTRFTLRVK